MVHHRKYPPLSYPKHLQSLKLLRPTVKEEMHLQESTLFQRNVAQYPLHHMTYAPAKFEAAMKSLKLLCPTVYEEMHLQEIFGQGHIKHCLLHHVTYVPAKFEVATANG